MKPLRFLFVNPIDYKSLVETSFPHLGLGSLSACLKQAFPGLETMVVRGHLQEWIHNWHPDLVGITAVSQYWNEAKFHAQRCKQGGLPVIIGGVHATALPHTMTEDMDVAVLTEGEETIVELVRLFQEGEFKPDSLAKIPGIAYHDHGQIVKSAERPMLPNLDVLPFADRSILPHSDHTSMFTSRGCPYRCLVGETIIHTLEGDVPISTQVGREDVMVLTRDPETQQPMYAAAIHICKTQMDAELVRVHFDDGSHIDCTPEHKFKVFSYKNQTIPKEIEWEIEAKDLKPKQQVRAVRFEVQKDGRVVVSSRRDICLYRGDLVLEASLGRKLMKGERCHHKDRNPGNDSPDNTVLTDKHHHLSLHPEFAERMRRNNPSWGIPPEKRSQNSHNNTIGRRRTLAQRLRYRESKLGAKNPRYKPDLPEQNRVHAKSRIKEVNHKVRLVERLEQREDVYCMEVPGIEWFYANKVLVHNCNFCFSTRYWKKMRFHSADRVAEEIHLLSRHVNRISFLDDLFIADKNRLAAIVDLLGRRDVLGKLKYICNVRSNLVNDDLCHLLNMLGVDVVGIGMESACQKSLEYLKGRGNITVEDHANAVEILRKHHIEPHPSFIIGSPFESREDIMETYRFIRDYKITNFEVYVLLPFPATPVWDYAASRGLVSDDMNWDRLRWQITDFGQNSIVLSETLTYSDLSELYNMFVRRREWPRRKDMLLQGAKHPLRAVKYLFQRL